MCGECSSKADARSCRGAAVGGAGPVGEPGDVCNYGKGGLELGR